MATQLNEELINKAAAILQEWGNEATVQMRKLLRSRTKARSKESNLSQSIDWLGSEVNKNGATIEWNLDDYWIYIDLGVKGLRNKSRTYTSKDNPSGFQFRSMATPPQMINAMQSYIARYGIQVRTSKTQSKQTIQELSFQKATAMSKAVKKNPVGYATSILKWF